VVASVVDLHHGRQGVDCGQVAAHRLPKLGALGNSSLLRANSIIAPARQHHAEQYCAGSDAGADYIAQFHVRTLLISPARSRFVLGLGPC
jgi:hypothetical protein